jgi:hypothetical protein
MKNYWKLKLSSVAIAFFFVWNSGIAQSQSSNPEISGDNEKYIYPVYPGKPGSLAGTMGELRTTHFHSGIDIRTNNVIGYPVVASKSGYISRVTVSPSGYGNIIYITHPDGNTTLYAHLEKFLGEVGEHVLQEQYNQKTFSIDLNFPPGRFPVKQGETIALSGNTGSSGGPHVHFDIRDKDNYALDPLKVADFPEIEDKLAPAPEKIAIKTLDMNSRINDRFGRFEFYAASKGGNKYSAATPLLVSGVIGIEIIAKDRLAPGSPFYGGVNHIEVRVDSQLVFNQNIEKIDIAETRGIYTLMDFKTLRNKGSRFYKLYIDDGNNLKFYENSPGNGKIRISGTKTSTISITLRDSYKNKSVISFDVRPSPVVQEVPTLEAMTTDILTDVTENTFMITSRPCHDSTGGAFLFVKGKSEKLTPAYYNTNRSVFLIDLRKTLPDSVVVCGKKVTTYYQEVVPSGTDYKYYSDFLEAEFPANALYDTLYLAERYQKYADREVFTLGDRTTPLNKAINVSIKPRQSYTKADKYDVYRAVGKSYTFLGGDFVNGRINFSTRELGDFTILQDNQPPTIKAVLVDKSNARFKIRDNLSGIDKYEANINGEWLLMHYDAKSATIWSEKLDKSIPFKGNFELIVTDNAGNQSRFTKKIL